MTISRFFYGFYGNRKWEPRLRLWIVLRKISSEWHVTGVPLSLLLSSFRAISYSNITPWWQGIGTFNTVIPRNDCVGESVAKLEEESLLWERVEILRQICDPGTPECSSTWSKHRSQTSQYWWRPNHPKPNQTKPKHSTMPTLWNFRKWMKTYFFFFFFLSNCWNESAQ